jgi:hypothetical protein
MIAVFAADGEAGRLGACSHYSDTLLRKSSSPTA